MYMVELGQMERTIAVQAMRAGQPLPDRIQNAPTLPLGLDLYLTAFFDLDSERSHGSGLTPIPWSSISAYADVFDFNWEQRCFLFQHIKLMDKEHLKRLEAKQKADMHAKQSAAPRRVKRPR